MVLGLLIFLATVAVVILFARIVFRESNPWWIFLLGIAALCYFPIVLIDFFELQREDAKILLIMWIAIPLFTIIISKIISKKWELRKICILFFGWVSFISIFLGGLFFTLGAIMPEGTNNARNASCESNLKQIGLSLHEYAQDHNDKFPERLLDIYPKYIVPDLRIFVCMSKHGEMYDRMSPDYYIPDRSKDPFADPLYKKMLLGEYLDYQYTKGLTENSPPTAIIVQDKEGNHPRGVVNVLFVGGHVETKNNSPWYRTFYLKNLPKGPGFLE